MDNDTSMRQLLDEIMTAIRPILSTHNRMESLARIQTVFADRSLKPAKYKGIMHENSFAVWILDTALQDKFRCTKIWVELIDESSNLLDRIYDLRDILSHEWLILVIDHEAVYTTYRPLIWAKVQGIKKIIAQM